MQEIGLHAFVDESGQRAARTKGASNHFVMAAAIVPTENLPDAVGALAGLRVDTGRNPGDVLHWNQIKQHSQRLRVVQSLGELPWLTVSAVVVCKQHLPETGINDDRGYLYTLRFLLERLSWFARDQDRVLGMTVAHVVRFKLEKLRAYEQILRTDPSCQIAWSALDPAGAKIDQPTRIELLQLGDLAASSIATAFEPDRFGNTEQRYLTELSPCLYRRKGNLTSYGLKLHPLSDSTRAAYPWVAAL